MGFYTHSNDKASGNGLAITEWNTLSSAVAGHSGLHLALNQADKLGVGTKSPGAKVDIRENLTGHVELRIHNERTTATGTGTALVFGGYRDVDPDFTIGKICVDHLPEGYGSGDLSHTGDMTFHTTSDINGPVERVRITRDGKVGIGTNIPNEALEVNGNIKFNNGYAIAAASSGVKVHTGNVTFATTGNGYFTQTVNHSGSFTDKTSYVVMADIQEVNVSNGGAVVMIAGCLITSANQVIIRYWQSHGDYPINVTINYIAVGT